MPRTLLLHVDIGEVGPKYVRMKTLIERFTERLAVDETTGCWGWTTGIDVRGYGVFRAPEFTPHRKQYAHRWSYSHYVRTLEPGEQVHHVCMNKRCVNPAHLQALTAEEHGRINERHSRFRERTHCSHGHEYTPENTYIHAKTGARYCRECSRARVNRHYARHLAVKQQRATSRH